MTTSHPTHRERILAVALALGATSLVFLPLALERKDSFPLSTYPMFALPRGNPELINLIAVTASGDHVAVPPSFLGTSEVLQAKAQLNQVAQKSKQARQRYCEAVAARVGREPQFHFQELRLQRARFNPIEYFENGGEPLTSVVLTSCNVVNETPAPRRSNDE